MKTLISVVLLLVLPMLSHALSIEDARHLWSRTGFHNANFILNKGNAKAEDILYLMEIIRTKVKQAYNYELQTEVCIW